MHNKKTYVIGKSFFNGIIERGDIIFIHYRKHKYRNPLKKLLWYFIRTCRFYSNVDTCHWGAELLFGKTFIDKIGEVTSSDKVFIWDIPSIKTNTLIRQELPTKEVMTFLWNPVCSLYQSKFSLWKFLHYKKKRNYIYSTFDEYDAKHYNMKLLPQVFDLRYIAKIASTVNANEDTLVDVAFLAEEKGRMNTIHNIYVTLCQEGLTSFFYIYHNKRVSCPPVMERFLYEERISYEDYITHVIHSRAILEIMQEGQVGMTLRSLEALVLNKKLITNNINIVNDELYHPNNVYILGYDNKYSSIKEFLNAPFTEWDEELIKKHDIHFWLYENIISPRFV